jgi:signal transduction histidine kinase
LYLRAAKRVSDADEAQRRALAHEKRRLEHDVRERTASLAELTNHLQTVQEKEREHLARELHDELGSLLMAAKLDVSRIRSKIPDTLPAIHDRIAHLIATLNDGIALKWRIIEDLRPSSLGNLGLVPALEILAREFQERSGTAVVTELEPAELADYAELAVYLMVQESFTNAAKYAAASEITVSLHSYVDRVEVIVADNGKGFDLSARHGSSFGLIGMRHRIESFGGTLRM